MATPSKANPAGGPANKTLNMLSPESKRDEFRRYLEKTGVMDALTRVLVGLYEEADRPTNPVDYFLEHLSTGAPIRAELESLRETLTGVQAQFTETDEDNKRLRVRLEKYEPVGDPPAAKPRRASNNANPASATSQAKVKEPESAATPEMAEKEATPM